MFLCIFSISNSVISGKSDSSVASRARLMHSLYPRAPILQSSDWNTLEISLLAHLSTILC